MADVLQLGPDLLPGRIYSLWEVGLLYAICFVKAIVVGDEISLKGYTFEGDRSRRHHFDSFGCMAAD